jgi:hypothetical protein
MDRAEMRVTAEMYRTLLANSPIAGLWCFPEVDRRPNPPYDEIAE